MKQPTVLCDLVLFLPIYGIRTILLLLVNMYSSVTISSATSFNGRADVGTLVPLTRRWNNVVLSVDHNLWGSELLGKRVLRFPTTFFLKLFLLKAEIYQQP